MFFSLENFDKDEEMPGLDWIPVVSQLKSMVQLLTGDAEGAARTQANYFQECPVLSQAVSLVQVVAGDTDGALETQKKCLGTLNNVANGLPVVGHVKGWLFRLEVTKENMFRRYSLCCWRYRRRPPCHERSQPFCRSP